ncbi:GntR family transcriptional regulator [Clavibacter sepedonicus]|uniref:GntR-family transcriptional regulator n=1 Tax=Clavibacter sepedonicus TaxID=31964 RepID=B0RFG8_CLASE|nr:MULTISPECIES: GntR family transcriptional regulator [Clavibacter]MBD5380378.1 GntR family transcriptional regulator [Clavibacter sp.]OQJ49378.1 GntR family transcriptional regulator [Clavibacter sepedonicus]OQJ54992.1 GntR family transcriptional regulator [Clavibacter sepedonicus]UUK64767.1 GntR family transcriptional regulator [Clavibacter sepedonicus]CAQ01027.1 putative GntR-family transcriptional regulator [Clavibacter sepedonicus]
MPRPRDAAAARTAIVTPGPVPKHAQLRAILLADIGSAWPAHTAIPSERELAMTHDVSRATVRQAIRQLIEEQRLHTVQGKGTFVAGERIQSQLHLASFTEDMRRRGMVATTLVRHARMGVPPLEARAALGLDEGEPAWSIERLRLANGTPMALEVGWYSARVAPDLGDHDLSASLYGVLAERYGVHIDGAEQTVWADAADADTAEALEVTPGASTLVFRRTSRAGGTPVEHVTSWYRGDRYQVHMALTGD